MLEVLKMFYCFTVAFWKIQMLISPLFKIRFSKEKAKQVAQRTFFRSVFEKIRNKSFIYNAVLYIDYYSWHCLLLKIEIPLKKYDLKVVSYVEVCNASFDKIILLHYRRILNARAGHNLICFCIRGPRRFYPTCSSCNGRHFSGQQPLCVNRLCLFWLKKFVFEVLLTRKLWKWWGHKNGGVLGIHYCTKVTNLVNI